MMYPMISAEWFPTISITTLITEYWSNYLGSFTYINESEPLLKLHWHSGMATLVSKVDVKIRFKLKIFHCSHLSVEEPQTSDTIIRRAHNLNVVVHVVTLKYRNTSLSQMVSCVVDMWLKKVQKWQETVWNQRVVMQNRTIKNNTFTYWIFVLNDHQPYARG